MNTFLLLILCLLVIAHVTKCQDWTPEQWAEYKKYAQDYFALYDTDTDGYVDLPEAVQKARKYSDISEESVQHMADSFIAYRDANGDGKVTFDEFYQLMMKWDFTDP